MKSKPHTYPNKSGVSASNFRLRKLRSGMNYAIRLEDHYNRKFGQVVTPAAIVKSLAVVSSTFEKNTRLWVLNVAPSRHLKTQTTQEQASIFPMKKLVYVGSDFTIHGIIRDYESGRKIDGKCLLVNDMTLLLASKAKQTKSRLVDALSELASEGRYIYRDFQQTYEVKARFSLIANITPHSFLVNRKNLLGNTFIERCLVVYHALTDVEMSEANLTRPQRITYKIDRFKQKLHESEVTISDADRVRFDEYARRWRILGAYSSSSSLFDMINSIAVAYAILSAHRRITSAEYRILDMVEPRLRNPNETVKLTILELAHQGRSTRDICNILNQDYDSYRPFISRVIADYRQRGIMSPYAQSLTQDQERN
ncbi:MAG: hypothetical protein ABSE39_03765 [Candidatus Bathyarchaeia archaeon]